MAEFDDGNDYMEFGTKNEVSFRSLVLSHLQRIMHYASVEFRGGYWEIKQIPVNMGGVGTTVTSKTYVPDSREVYSNAIECLSDVLYPHFDEEMIKAEEKISKEIAVAWNKYTVEPTRTDSGEEQSIDSLDREFEDEDKKISFRDAKVSSCRKLFRELSKFLHRKSYLELGSIQD